MEQMVLEHWPLLLAAGCVAGVVGDRLLERWKEQRKIAETRLIVDKFQNWIVNYAQADDQ